MAQETAKKAIGRAAPAERLQQPAKLPGEYASRRRESSYWDEVSSVQLQLRRPPFWSGRFAAVLFGVLIVWDAHLLSATLRIQAEWTATRLLIHAAALLGPLLIGICYRLMTRPRFGPMVVFQPEAVLLPRSADTTLMSPIAYRDVMSIDLRGRAPREQLFVGSRRQLFVYPVGAFENPEGAERLRVELRRRIADQPRGAKLIRDIERRGHVAWVAMGRAPIGTLLFAIIVAATFALQLLLGADQRPFGLVIMGANAPALVRDGELFRLVSANLLHAHFLHCYMNVLALLVLGNALERLHGHARFLVVLLLSALGGALASTIAAQAAFSVGASTAVFGLLGSLAVLNLRFRLELPAGFRQSLRWWGVVLGLSALLPVLVPQIDVAAHAGGFCAGALTTWLMYRRVGALRIHTPSSLAHRIAAAAMVLIFATGVGISSWKVFIDDRESEVMLARAILEGLAASPSTLNRVAADFASARDATAGHLELAREAAQRAVALEPANSDYLSNLAGVYQRLGLVEQALATQHKVVERGESVQSTRRMAELLRASGHSLEPTSTVRVELEPHDDGPGPPRAVMVELEQAQEEGLVVYAHVMQGSYELGLFRACFGATPAGRFRFAPVDHYFDAWPEGVRFEIVLAEPWGQDYADGSWRWQYWHLGPDIDALR